MSLWVRVLVFASFGTFALLALVLVTQGNGKAALGALILASLIAPLLLEASFPGKYALRKPADGSRDTLLNRMKQFRTDHPGTDGTLLLAIMSAIALVVLVGGLIRLLQLFLHG